MNWTKVTLSENVEKELKPIDKMKFVEDVIRTSKEPSTSFHRIPLALQAIFLESNQGGDVHIPPCNNLASKVFEPVTTGYMNQNKRHRNVVGKKFRESALRKMLLVRKNIKGSCKGLADSSTTKGTSINSTTQTNKQESRKKQKDAGRRNKKLKPNHCFSKQLNFPLNEPKKPLPTLSPQDYLTGLLRSRGYCTKQYNAIDIGYNTKPTPLQKASYGSYMIEVIKKDNDEKRLVQLLKCGLSSNPCNDFGESIVHMVCRLGKLSMLQSLLEYGCDIHVADINGRTPLHEACWSHKPQFQLVDMLLQIDPQLLLVSDIRNTLPLSFAPRECWTEWLQYIESKKDVYWPKRNQYLDRKIQEPKWNLASLRPRIQKSKARKVIQSPTLKQKWVPVLPLKVVSLVATGKVDPREALILSLDLDDLSYADDSDEWFSNYNSGIDDDDDDDDDLTCESDVIDSKNEVDNYLIESSEKGNLSPSSCEDGIKCIDNGSKFNLPVSDQFLNKKAGDETEFLLDEKEMIDLLYCFSNLTKGVTHKKGGGITWMCDGNRCQTNTNSTATTCSDSISLSGDSTSIHCCESVGCCDSINGTISTTPTASTCLELDITMRQSNIATINAVHLENASDYVNEFSGPIVSDDVFDECKKISEIVENIDMPHFSDIHQMVRSLMYFY